MPENKVNIPSPLVLYDGQCALCNCTVRFLLRADQKGVLRFAPLESKTGRHIRALPSFPASSPDSVVLYEGGRVYWYSDALIAILAHLPRPYRWGRVLRYLPLSLRDLIYRWVARTRKKLFLKKTACPILPPAYRERFLPSLPEEP